MLLEKKMPEIKPGTTDTLSPSQRLEQSRRALLETMRPGATAAMDKARKIAEEAQLAQAPELPNPVTVQTPSFVTEAILQPDPPTTAARDAAAVAEPQPHARPARESRAARRTARAWSLSGLVDSDTGRALSTGALAAQRLLNAWWRRHPLHAVAEIGEPLVEKYARRHPYRLLAIAAALGAAVVVLKPWRWNGTRRWARSSVNRELQSMNFSRLSQMVVDSLLHNGRR